MDVVCKGNKEYDQPLNLSRRVPMGSMGSMGSRRARSTRYRETRPTGGLPAGDI